MNFSYLKRAFVVLTLLALTVGVCWSAQPKRKVARSKAKTTVVAKKKNAQAQLEKRYDDAIEEWFGGDPAKGWQQLIECANDGCADAMREVGQAHHFGTNDTEINTAKAISWLEKAASLGDADAFVCLGDIFADDVRDEGIENWDKAEEYYNEAIKLGSIDGAVRLGDMWYKHYDDRACAQFEKAFDLLEKEKYSISFYSRALHTSQCALYSLLCYVDNKCGGKSTNTKKIQYWEEKLEKHATVDDRYTYGHRLYLKDDKAKAIKWLTACSDRMERFGYREAEYELGNIYRCGWGVPKDYTKAWQWYTKAAVHKDARAACDLAFMVLCDQAPADNELTPFDCYYHGATKCKGEGVGEAAYHVAWYYHEGLYVKKDIGEAVKWYRKAISLTEEDDYCNKESKKALKELGYSY